MAYLLGFAQFPQTFPPRYVNTKTLQKEWKLSMQRWPSGGVVLGGYFVSSRHGGEGRISEKKHHPLGGVFGAGDEARTRFPASHEWLSPFVGALPHLRSNVLRTGRGSEFSGAAAHSKKNTPSCRMGYSFWSGRRGSNSLPRPWQGRALPDELRPQTQD